MLTLLLASLLLCTSQIIVAGGPADYTVSGYVLDSNGNPIANATVTFVRGTPVYPHCYTNGSGYYELKPYSGENTVSIQPPANTNFVKYTQEDFDVQTNMAANFTLSLGYRLSGLVVDQNLQPVKPDINSSGGVGIFLDSYFSRTWADSNGAYYVVAPQGTYTIYARHVQPASWGSVSYDTEYEIINGANISLNKDTTATIIINLSTPTSTPTPTTATAGSTTATDTPTGATSQPTPAVPETPAWIIIPLGLLLTAAVCSLTIKNQKRINYG